MAHKNILLLFLFSMTLISDNYIVKTSSGITKGYVSNNVINWDDIPYAKPPVNELRYCVILSLLSL